MNDHPDTPLDTAIRAHHQASLQHLSPRARAQLAQRRNAALRGTAVSRPHGVRYAAAGFAALCALAIGLRFGTMPSPTQQGAPGSVATTAPTDATMLDEDPEFYAWLASSDAQLVAKE